MMYLRGPLGLILAAILALPAIAAPNHNFLELSFSTGELDMGVSGLGSADIDQDGLKLEGSVSPTENVLLRASYSALSGDEAGLDLDVDTTSIGAGWIIPVSDNTDMDISLEYRKDELDASGIGSADADGAGISVGVRSDVSNNLEMAARLAYLGSDYDGGYVLDISGTYALSDQFGISLGLERLDMDEQGVSLELNQIQLGARLRF